MSHGTIIFITADAWLSWECEKMPKKKQSQTKKQSSKKEKLIENLMKMLKDVDEEGLIFLTKQANVLLYNMRAEEINKQAKEINKKNVSQEKEAPGKQYAVDVEEKNDGKHFYIILNNSRVFFIRDEIHSIVKICHASNNGRDASQRLYRWFSKNRKDLLIDGGIESSKNPFLANIYEKLVSTYKVKDK